MNVAAGLLIVALVGGETPPAESSAGPVCPARQPGACAANGGCCEDEAGKDPAATATEPTPLEDDRDVWALTLAEAIRIGLGHSELLRLVPCDASSRPDRDREPPATGADLAGLEEVIIPLDGGRTPWRLKREVMAHVRSVEQLYWALAELHERSVMAAGVVELAEQAIEGEANEVEEGRGGGPRLAPAMRRLNEFRAVLAETTAERNHTEQQLRRILGVPKDARRIVPASAPRVDRVPRDWDECVAQMMTCQPDLAEQRTRVLSAGLRCLAGGGLDLAHLTLEPAARPTGDDADPAGEQFRKERGRFDQVLHQSSHTLARFFLELDANHKQFEVASRLADDARRRLETRAALYAEGRITLDGYLDAVEQHAAAVAHRAASRTSYNVAIVALEEARGTLLAYNHMAVVERYETASKTPCNPANVAIVSLEQVTGREAARNRGTATRLELQSTDRRRAWSPHVRVGKVWRPMASPPLAVGDPAIAKASGDAGRDTSPGPQIAPATAHADRASKTVTFDITVGELKPIRVRGSLTIGEGTGATQPPR